MTDEQRERKKAYLREWYAKNRERQIAAVGAWPSGTVAGWILAWAGDYANEADNANYVLPAPTFKEIGMETAIAVPITAFLNDRVYWGILK